MRRAFRAAALVALLAATAFAAETVSRTVTSHTFDHETTAKKRYELPAPGGGRVRLRVRASVTGGEFRLVVRDAEGRVRQEAQLGPRKEKPLTYDVDSGEVRSAAGVWTVEVELKDAVGSYEFTWTAEPGR